MDKKQIIFTLLTILCLNAKPLMAMEFNNNNDDDLFADLTPLQLDMHLDPDFLDCAEPRQKRHQPEPPVVHIAPSNPQPDDAHIERIKTIQSQARPPAMQVTTQPQEQQNVQAPTAEQIQLNEQLLDACKKQKPLKTITKLLQAGANCNMPDEDGLTALILAARENNDYGALLVQRLIAYGADVNGRTTFNITALQASRAAAGTNRKGHWKIIEHLVRNGAECNERELFLNAIEKNHPPLYNLFLERGVSVNCRGKNWTTPLHEAAQQNNTELCKQLLERGAKVDAETTSGTTPLMFAAARNNLDLCEILLEHGANVNAIDRDERTALMMAGNADTISLLCDWGANLNMRNSYGKIAFAGSSQEKIKAMIVGAFFNPVYSFQEIDDAREQIFTALLVFKRVCPALNRDMRHFILERAPELQNALRCCAFGIHKGHNERAPFLTVQTVRTLLQHGFLKPELVVQFVKENQYKNLIPLMDEAFQMTRHSWLSRNKAPLLNPEHLEEQHGAEIEANIRRMFNLDAEVPQLEWVTTRKRGKKEESI